MGVQRISFGLALLLILACAAAATAGGVLFPGKCPQCGCKSCVPEPVTTKTKKHCWEVECKDVCIPKFKWPWEPCCQEPACGRVRTVKVLKMKEYECESCGYKWTVKTVDDCCPAK